MSQVSAHPPSADRTYAASSQPTSRLDRFALALTKPTNIKRWYVLVAAFCAVLIAVMLYFILFVLPEGSDVAGTVALYVRFNTVLRVVSALLAVLFLVGALWSAAFIGTLWVVDPSRNRVYTWSALISELLVLGLFFVEAGILAATTLLSGHAPDSIIHSFHILLAVSAALLGPVWIPYTLGALLISRRTGLFPSWLNKLCVVVILVDICTITGVFTLSGPLNGANGIIGTFAGGLGPVLWVGGVIAWEVVEWAQYRTSALSAVAK